MKKLTKILWGIALVLAGGIFALKALGLTNIEVFFDGWWTLFIIVPCLVGIFTEREKTGNIIGFFIGVFLLLCCQEVLDFSMFWKLAVPVIIVVVGIKLIITAIIGDKATKLLIQSHKSGDNVKSGSAVFSGQDINYGGEVFEGAELTAVFGGIECDLRNAVIEKDTAINATAVFGGIDIFVPDNINVKITSNSVFGGASKKKGKPYVENGVTLYVNATCIFGGVEIK
ncbi:MAG: LiaF-related protein [Acutalibacteraceae bacterium]|nr:LiaF-related protein [Acutalibacteraceae bacterium]